MNSDNENIDDKCRICEELAVWYPTGSLTADEKCLVEEHVAECDSCRNLLHFVREFSEDVAEAFSPHPGADMLVLFAEDRDALSPEERKRVETHIASCRECRAEIGMLEIVEIDAGSEGDRAVSRGSGAGRIKGKKGAGSSWWEIFSRVVLSPAAAAAYIVMILVAAGLLLSRPDPPRDKEGVLGGVSILPDQTDAFRGESQGPGGTTIKADRPEFLLLELTGFDGDPAHGDRYEVRITADGSPNPVFLQSITGSEFSDDYTICIYLASGTIARGEYVVEVLDPEGQGIFRSLLTVE